MKNESTGKISPIEDPDCPRTKAGDWEGAVRYSPDVLAAFRATGRGWQTRMNDALRDWLKTHSPV